MRLNDRSIRDELRKQALSVPIPDDMWANISRELDHDAARVKAAPAPRPAARQVSRGLQIRQMLAVGAAAGIFWMMVIPSGAYVDRFQRPGPGPAASPAAATAHAEVPWDIPTESHMKERPIAGSKGSTVDARRPAHETNISR